MKTLKQLSVAGLLATLLSLSITMPAFAQMYKWTDADGQVHFSDSKPSDVQDKKSLEVIKKAPQQEVTENSLKTRDTSLAARPILITAPQLPWEEDQWRVGESNDSSATKKNIGLYHFGESCTSPTAMILPDAERLHPRLFPSSALIGGQIVEILRAHGYPSFWRPAKELIVRSHFKDGINIDTRITSVKYQVCSKSNTRNYRNTAISKFSASNFSYKKVSMTIAWDISKIDGEVLQTFSSKVSANVWQKDRGHVDTFSQAFDKALVQLFSEDEFQNLLHDGYEKPVDTDNAADADTSESLLDKSSQLYAMLQEKLASYAGFGKQAQLSEALIILQQVKTHATQYYLSEGYWPESLDTLGLSAADYANNSDILDRIYAGADGSITMEFSNSFSEDSMMEFRPNASGNSNITWQCASNLSAQHVPASLNCQALY